MKKLCVVCGKSIKTGRKYCWRHRAYSSEFTDSHLLTQAKKAYKKRMRLIVAIIGFISITLAIPSIVYISKAQSLNNFDGYLSLTFLTIVAVLVLCYLLRINLADLIVEIKQNLNTRGYKKFIVKYSKKYKKRMNQEKDLVK